MVNNLLNPFAREVRPGISLFTAVKNRKENLEDSLQSWITHPEIDEIIILDWDSEESLESLVGKYQDGRIYLARAADQPRWILSFACNLSARLTSREKVLKMDADVKILPGFFQKHELQPGRFFCGNWRKRRNDNELHLNGMAFLYRQDFFHVNGYNEFIKFYGWDDSDLYQRLEASGLQRLDLDYDTLHHIPHSNRTLHQNKSNALQELPEEEWAYLATLVNRHVGTTYGTWDIAKQMIPFTVKPATSHLMTALQCGSDENLLPPEKLAESELVALRERLHMLDNRMNEPMLARLDRTDLVTLYRLFLGRKTDQNAQELYNLILKLGQ